MGEKRWLFVVGLVLAAVTSATLIINPTLTQMLIDNVITPQDTTMLLPLLGAMLAVQTVRLTLRYLMVMALEENSQHMLDRIRRKLYDVIQNQDHRFFGVFRTGDLMTRMTNDLDLVRHTTAWISYNVVDSITLFTVTLAYFFSVNAKLTLWLAITTPLILVITRIFSKIVNPMYVRLREKLSFLNITAQENIAGNRVVKAFAREDHERQRFEQANADYRNSSLATTYVGVRFQPIIELLSQSMTVTTLLVGGIFMMRGELTAGEMYAFSSLTWALSNPLRNLGMLINDIQRFFASCTMVMEVFYAQPSIVDHAGAETPKERPAGTVDFKNVCFTVDGREILHDVTFHVEPGQTLGIMGVTGSGKTTLVNLLLRFYQPSEGEILLDGKDTNRLTLESLRASIGLAMQDVFLFSDTAHANIAYGEPELTADEARIYARFAAADDFIEELSNGYDTLIGERGVGLSGGQRQRIALARALAKRPSVLVLDDTTSALDMETEQYIQKQLRGLPDPCTKIIVAQRVSSVRHAEQIIVLDGGRIVERGTHEELLKHDGFYRRVWELQNGSEGGGELGA